jgi:hypothetical protein
MLASKSEGVSVPDVAVPEWEPGVFYFFDGRLSDVVSHRGQVFYAIEYPRHQSSASFDDDLPPANGRDHSKPAPNPPPRGLL